MSTPAEIIAARVNGLHLNNGASVNGNGDHSATDDEYESHYDLSSSTTDSTSPSITDESAFPTLGGKKSTATGSTPSWGPSLKAPTPASTASIPLASSSSASTPKVSTPTNKFKASTIQAAFSLDAEDQLNVTKPEFIKILTSIKADTKTNIECTTSQHTKKRTFLITGKTEQVKEAKRLVIKKLTKLVKIAFSIPAEVRSKVIGPQGRTIKSITQKHEVKVTVGNADEAQVTENENELPTKTIVVNIEGDFEGARRAKEEINAIVKEETKNLSVKINVEPEIKPFVTKALAPIVTKYADLEFSIPTYNSSSTKITVNGERAQVAQAYEEINEILKSLQATIVTESVEIPKIKHQFLPVESVLEQFNVLIKLPEDNETAVKFIGDKKKFDAAKEQARKTTSQYKVEVLDMSKAHKGNLPHVKAVAALLNKNGSFKTIGQEAGVSINAPSAELTGSESSTSIPIEIVAKVNEVEEIKNAKKSIVSLVSSLKPENTKVIEDIDEFLLNKVPETINEAAEKNNVEYVVLGKRIILFSKAEAQTEADDFDFDDSNSDESLDKVNKSLDSLRELASELDSVVLSVPHDEQSNISGPRNTTLKSILAAYPPNSVIIKLHNNKDGSSKDEVFIQGLKSEVSKIKKDIESVLKDAAEFKETGGYKTSIEIPSFVLSRIIGKNGASIQALKEEFGTKIDVEDEGKQASNDDKNAKTTITIAGIKRNADETKNRISQLSKRFADESLVRLRIEQQYHRRMIGASGVYINRLQDKYNVKIRFPSSDNTPSNFADAPQSKDEVTIKGPSKGVTKAVEELKELHQFEKENGFKETLKIPSKAIARVIGKSGETIKDIADGCGIEYKFNSEHEAEGYGEFELMGSKTALKEAIKKIQEIVDEVESFTSVTINVDPKYHRDLVGPGGSIMKEIISKAGGDDVPRNKYYRLLSIPNESSGSDEVTSKGDKAIVEKIIQQVKDIIAIKEASITEEYDLAKEKHKLIVGPSGSIRHALQDEFGVNIIIPRPNDESTIIKLTGLEDNINALKEKIETITKDDWNVAIDVPERYHALVSEKGSIFKELKNNYNVEVQHGVLNRQASKLSSASSPPPPTEALPAEEEDFKFTIAPLETSNESDVVIPWRLKGDKKDTDKVAEIIRARLQQAQESTHSGWFYAANSSTFTKLVGRQGSVVKKIRAQTKNFIAVPKTTDKYSNFIYLVGNPQSLAAAEEAIKKYL